MADTDKSVEELDELLSNCGPFFSAMGDTVRQKLFMNMAKAGTEGVNVSNLTADTSLSRPAISHHLKVLKDCGLIESYREGTKNFYYVELRRKLEEVRSFIDAVEKLLDAKASAR